MLYSSLAYAGLGALLGAAVVLVGLPVYAWVRHKNRTLVAQGSPWPAEFATDRDSRC